MEYHLIVVPTEEAVQIVQCLLHRHRIQQRQDLVRSEEYHLTAVPTEGQGQTVRNHHQHHLPRLPQDLVHSEVFHHTVALTAVRVQTVLFLQNQHQQLLGHVHLVEYHHIVVQMEDQDQTV